MSAGSVILALACGACALLAACGGGGATDDASDGPQTPAAPAVAPMPPDASSCRNGDEAVQRHGTPCLCCHGDEFGVAGSIDPAGPAVARIVVTGADGDVADMALNPFGNFFRHFPLATPVSAVVVSPDGRSIAMRELAPSADCNACHYAGGPVAPIVGP
jgi:hypothetical protein